MDSHFQRAKIDHYLDQAQEYVRMARLLAAKRPLARVLNLDPHNQAGRTLQKDIQQVLTSLVNGANRIVAQPGGQESPRRMRRSELIMIVDQDERVLERLAASLHRHGFRVVSAGTYREAVELLSLVAPSLVISEINFENGPAGFDLYLLLRTNANLQNVPFLFLATRMDRQVVIAGKRLGVNDFVLKPVDEEIVYASVVSCLLRNRMMNSAH